MNIRAIYENGVFKPREDVPIKEGTEVEVFPVGEHKTKSARPKSVKELGAYGMWKDRTDIGSGVEYVNRIRKHRREPERK